MQAIRESAGRVASGGFAKRLACGALLAASLASPALATPSDLGSFQVTRPDALLFDRAARREALAAMPADQRDRICGADRSGWPKHGVVQNVYNGTQPGEGFVLTMMVAAAAAFGTGDDAAAKAVVSNLRRWAEGDALSRFKENPAASMYYNLDRTLLPVIVAFSLVRDDPAITGSERERIGAWLNDLVWRRGPGRERDPDLTSSRNNHRYLSDSVTMAWSILVGDDDGFRVGVERYLTALGQMREDGSLPLETARGASALSYQRHAIASLVTIAEMAAAQGYDLYAIEGPQGQSIHRAITFLLDGIDDPSLVWPYARQNNNPRSHRNYKVQDLSFMAERGHGRHYMAWTEPYLTRFPNTELADRLRQALAEFGPAERPLIDDYSGGNMSCFFALPDENDESS